MSLKVDSSKDLGPVAGVCAGLLLLTVTLVLMYYEFNSLKSGKIWSLDKHHFGSEYDFVNIKEKPLMFWLTFVGSMFCLVGLGWIAIWLLKDGIAQLFFKFERHTPTKARVVPKRIKRRDG